MNIRDFLKVRVEQGEPTITGEFLIVDMQSLIDEGYQYLEVHFGADDTHPNAIRLSRENGDFVG